MPRVLRRHRAVRQRQPAPLHRQPRATPAGTISASRASTSASATAKGQPPHLVGEYLLRRFGIAPGTRDAHAFTYLDFAPAARAYGTARRLRASRDAGQKAEGVAAGRAAARRRGRVAGLGDGAVDEGPGHGRRAKGARRRHHDRPLGIHLGADRVKEIVDNDFAGHIEFVAQNVKTADFGDPVFAPYAMRVINGVPCRDRRPGISVHADRESTLLRLRLDVRHSRGRHAEDGRRRARARARKSSCCCRITAWTSTSSSPRGSRGSTRSLAVTRTMACRSPPWSRIAAARTLVTNAGCSGKFLAVLDLDVKGGKVADYPIPVVARVQRAAACGSRRWTR